MQLVGKTVEAVQISKDQELIRFHTDDILHSIVCWRACGDCCSESWFADVYSLDELIGHLVTEVREIPMPAYNADDGRCRQESDEVYGIEIKTVAGSCVIVFRNSSNGCYGGWLQTESPDVKTEWEEISKGWSAPGIKKESDSDE